MTQPSTIALSIMFTMFQDSITYRRLRSTLNDHVNESNFTSRFTRRKTSISSFSISLTSRTKSSYLKSSRQNIRISISRLTRFYNQRFTRKSTFSSSNIIRRGISNSRFLFRTNSRDLRHFLINRITRMSINLSSFFTMND